MAEKLRIAFFGLPLAALLLLEDGHDVVHASICRDDAVGLYRLRRRLARDRVSVQPRVDAAHVAKLRALSPDVVVSWFWTKRLPAAILKLAPHGALGVHPSLLPRHRGPDPYFWTIDSGDPVAGVSAHWLEEEYDTGAVIASRTLDVDPSWNAWTLAKALDRPSLALLRRVVRDLAALGPGEKLPSIAQDAAHATSAPTPSDADLEIDWNCTCAQIARRVRAAAPYPGVFTELAGQEFVLVSVASLPLSRELAALVPGEMVVHGERPVVRASDGGIEIRKASVGDGPILEGSTLVDLCRRAL